MELLVQELGLHDGLLQQIPVQVGLAGKCVGFWLLSWLCTRTALDWRSVLKRL
jgi:hypothetical protein